MCGRFGLGIVNVFYVKSEPRPVRGLVGDENFLPYFYVAGGFKIYAHSVMIQIAAASGILSYNPGVRGLGGSFVVAELG